MRIVANTEVEGLILFLQRIISQHEQSRQSPSLDIPQMETGDYEWKFYLPRNLTASEAVGLWLLCQAEKPLWKEELRVSLLERCKRYQYQGKWMDLFHLLSTDTLTLVVYKALEIFHPRDLCGNIIPKVTKAYWKVGFYLVKKPKPVYPQFHRGYRDHGHRRLVHEIHDLSWESGPNPQTIELDSNVKKKNFILNFLYG